MGETRAGHIRYEADADKRGYFLRYEGWTIDYPLDVTKQEGDEIVFVFFEPDDNEYYDLTIDMKNGV